MKCLRRGGGGYRPVIGFFLLQTIGTISAFQNPLSVDLYYRHITLCTKNLLRFDNSAQSPEKNVVMEQRAALEEVPSWKSELRA